MPPNINNNKNIIIMVKTMNELAEMAMSEREMNSFAGGDTCGCACRSVSTMDNGSANHTGGLYSNGPKTDQTIFLDEVVVTP